MPDDPLPAGELAVMVSREYDLGEAACTFIGAGFNDHYLIRTPSAKAVLRVYLDGKYYIGSRDDFATELEILSYVSNQGVRVAAPIPRCDGSLLGSFGRRAVALFEYAAGEEIRDPTDPQAAGLAAELARFHLTADGFTGSRRRHRLGVRELLERPLDFIREDPIAARGHLDPHETLAGLTDPARLPRLVAVLESLPDTAGAYGLIHADPHPRNARFDGDHPTLFDFDHCAWGRRAYDLAILLRELPDARWAAAVRGYEKVRPLTDVERDALPELAEIRRIWDVGDLVAMEPLMRGRRGSMTGESAPGDVLERDR